VAVQNPQYLPCDTDSLIQIFIARHQRVLVHLRERYGVLPVVVPEVEMEVSRNRKFKGRFAPALADAVGSGHLTVLSDDEMRRGLVRVGHTATQAEQTVQRVQQRGRRYQSHVGRGEAYSHAAAVELQVPIMSHDWEAVEVLSGLSEQVGVPTLRTWDLFALALDDGAVTLEDGERGVAYLQDGDEHVPAFLARANPSFGDALKNFDSRLRRRQSGTPPQPQGPKDRLFIEPLP
jgi:hypothetical protein